MKDYLGHELKVGDYVVTKSCYTTSAYFQKAFIYRMTAKKAFLVFPDGYGGYMDIQRRDPHSIVKIVDADHKEIKEQLNSLKQKYMAHIERGFTNSEYHHLENAKLWE